MCITWCIVGDVHGERGELEGSMYLQPYPLLMLMMIVG